MEQYAGGTGNAGYAGNELVSYNQASGELQISGTKNCCYPYPFDSFYHYYPIYYPSVQYVTEKDKVSQAFRIMTKLIENKIIEKEITVKELIKMVNDIASIL